MTPIEALTDRLLLLTLGCFIGLSLGWTVQLLHDAKKDFEQTLMAHTRVPHHTNIRNDSGFTDIRSVALFVVVLLVAGSAVISGLAASSVGSTQDEVRNSQECTESVLANVIRTINERTTFSSEINKADKQQNEAFLIIATLSLNVKEPLPEADRLALIKDYRDKLNEYLNLLDKAGTTQMKNPYPEIDDYRECLHTARTTKDKTDG